MSTVHLYSTEIEANKEGTGVYLQIHSVNPSSFFVADSDGFDLEWFTSIKAAREWADECAKTYFDCYDVD